MTQHTSLTERLNSLPRIDQMLLEQQGNFMVEGLIIDEDKYIVKLTDENNDGIDIRLVANPVEYDYKGMHIISIFRRKNIPGYSEDGNPFIYALKGINGWKFDMSDIEINKYIRCFLKIVRKVNSHFDTVIQVPSSHSINHRFMECISKQLNIPNKIDDYFMKCTKNEVWSYINRDEIESWCEKKYPKTYDYMTTNIMRQINAAFKKMGKYFESKHYPKEYTQFLHTVVSVNKDTEIADIAPLIDDKDILILDYTISSGITVSHCVNAINEMFNPKSITVITLLSKKFK